MIVSAEKCLSNSDRVTDMFKDTPAFSGDRCKQQIYSPYREDVLEQQMNVFLHSYS